MSTTEKQKNVFICHDGKDDEHISKIKNLLKEKDYVLKNSSIDNTKPNQASDPDYIKSMLRQRIDWAGVVIVLIGQKTHTRDWVDWEIEEANRQGKRIVGIHVYDESDADVPEALEKYGDALVGWNSEKIIDAIEGNPDDWNNTDGSPRDSKYTPERFDC